MTTTQHQPQHRPSAPRQGDGRGRTTRSRKRLAVTLVTGVMAVGGVTAAVLLPDGDGAGSSGLKLPGVDLPFVGGSGDDAGGGAAAPPTAPIALPDRVAGRGTLPQTADPLQQPSWREKARVATAGAAFAAQGYGRTDQNETFQVVAARTDLTGKLDIALAADAGQQLGENRCTQNTQLVPGGPVKVRPTVVVCWRTGTHLSASVVLITPRRTVTPAEGSAALDEVWTAVTKG